MGCTELYVLEQVILTVEDGVLVDGEGNSTSLVGDELRAKNGYAHAVDGVLFPADLITLTENMNAPDASFEGVFDIFLAGVKRAGLEDALSGVTGPYTVSIDPTQMFPVDVIDGVPTDPSDLLPLPIYES